MHEDVVQHFDEKPAGSLLYSTYLYATLPMTDALPLNQKLAFAQFDVIRRVAENGDCVIVGRCADYVLQERNDCLNVFITATNPVRHQRLATYYGIPEELADKTIKKQDKMRAELLQFLHAAQVGRRIQLPHLPGMRDSLHWTAQRRCLPMLSASWKANSRLFPADRLFLRIVFRFGFLFRRICQPAVSRRVRLPPRPSWPRSLSGLARFKRTPPRFRLIPQPWGCTA